MDFQKVEDFLRNHWPAALMVAILVAPSAWGFAYLHYGERITLLDTRVKDLEKTIGQLRERVSVLDQLAERKLEPSGIAFRPEDLFTPSPTPPTK
jgi:RNA binding exosome subunit